MVINPAIADISDALQQRKRSGGQHGRGQDAPPAQAQAADADQDKQSPYHQHKGAGAENALQRQGDFRIGRHSPSPPAGSVRQTYPVCSSKAVSSVPWRAATVSPMASFARQARGESSSIRSVSTPSLICSRT